MFLLFVLCVTKERTLFYRLFEFVIAAKETECFESFYVFLVFMLIQNY